MKLTYLPFMSKESNLATPLKWEFWPYWLFYIPIYFLFIGHAVRSRSLCYFTLVNPGMKLGGFASYSKFEILEQLHPKYLPKTILLNIVRQKEVVLEKMAEQNIFFPIILKPEEGERGWRVEKICSEKELDQYLVSAPKKLLLQEFIDLPEEYGVMYYRLPSQKKGFISSLMKRDFLAVTGDGSATLLELLYQSKRCSHHLARLKQKFQNELNVILSFGEKKILEEIGNHNRGTAFLNLNDLINSDLVLAFDQVSTPLHEWYFGRYDVKTKSLEAMIEGDFQVIEVNGVNSEPAHIYDSSMSLLKAYRDLFIHWNIILKISIENRKRGFKAAPMLDVYRSLRDHFRDKALA